MNNTEVQRGVGRPGQSEQGYIGYRNEDLESQMETANIVIAVIVTTVCTISLLLNSVQFTRMTKILQKFKLITLLPFMGPSVISKLLQQSIYTVNEIYLSFLSIASPEPDPYFYGIFIRKKYISAVQSLLGILIMLFLGLILKLGYLFLTRKVKYNVNANELEGTSSAQNPFELINTRRRKLKASTFKVFSEDFAHDFFQTLFFEIFWATLIFARSHSFLSYGDNFWAEAFNIVACIIMIILLISYFVLSIFLFYSNINEKVYEQYLEWRPTGPVKTLRLEIEEKVNKRLKQLEAEQKIKAELHVRLSAISEKIEGEVSESERFDSTTNRNNLSRGADTGGRTSKFGGNRSGGHRSGGTYKRPPLAPPRSDRTAPAPRNFDSSKSRGRSNESRPLVNKALKEPSGGQGKLQKSLGVEFNYLKSNGSQNDSFSYNNSTEKIGDSPHPQHSSDRRSNLSPSNKAKQMSPIKGKGNNLKLPLSPSKGYHSESTSIKKGGISNNLLGLHKAPRLRAGDLNTFSVTQFNFSKNSSSETSGQTPITPGSDAQPPKLLNTKSPIVIREMIKPKILEEDSEKEDEPRGPKNSPPKFIFSEVDANPFQSNRPVPGPQKKRKKSLERLETIQETVYMLPGQSGVKGPKISPLRVFFYRLDKNIFSLFRRELYVSKLNFGTKLIILADYYKECVMMTVLAFCEDYSTFVFLIYLAMVIIYIAITCILAAAVEAVRKDTYKMGYVRIAGFYFTKNFYRISELVVLLLPGVMFFGGLGEDGEVTRANYYLSGSIFLGFFVVVVGVFFVHFLYKVGLVLLAVQKVVAQRGMEILKKENKRRSSKIKKKGDLNKNMGEESQRSLNGKNNRNQKKENDKRGKSKDGLLIQVNSNLFGY